MRSDRALLRGLRLFLLSALLLAVAAGGASATTSSSQRAKPPAGWVGEIKFDYTFVQDGVESTQASETASVTLRHIKKRSAQYYEVKVGKITWQASGEDTSCSWSGSGSRAAIPNDAFLQLSARAPWKAYWSSPDDLQIRVLRTCGSQASEVDETILHPFFVLFRKVAGVPVAKNLKSIKGSSPRSSGGETWKYTWSFRAIR